MFKFVGDSYPLHYLPFGATITDTCMDLSLVVPGSVLPVAQTLYYNGDSAISLVMKSSDITIDNNPNLLCPPFEYRIFTAPASP